VINITTPSELTKIYLVTNCYGDPNKVYIGKTTKNREYAHKRKYGSNIIYTYIDEVNSLNRKDWKPLECFWIEYFRQLGFDLMNGNKGGGGPSEYSDLIKFKMRKPKSNNLNYFWKEDRRNKIHYLKGTSQNNEWIVNRIQKRFKKIKSISNLNEIIIFDSILICNNYFINILNQKTFLGSINGSLKRKHIITQGKLKGYKFEYVDI
jgi:hypothetical protein